MQRPPLVLSIQSQVVMGHVGNSAAVFPLQAAGLDVAQIPTVLLSNTPFYPTLRGRALPLDFFADLLLGAEERGLPERASYLVTGYLGAPDVAARTADFVARAKEKNPGLIYLCDPVVGDTRPGRYVPEETAQVIRERLLPLADIATPNPFEVAYLAGRPLATMADLDPAARKLGLGASAQLIATGCTLEDTPEGMIETLVHGPSGSSRHPVALQPAHISGTGDLFAALILAGLASGRTVSQAVPQAQVQMSRAIARARALDMAEVSLSDAAFRRDLLEAGL